MLSEHPYLSNTSIVALFPVCALGELHQLFCPKGPMCCVPSWTIWAEEVSKTPCWTGLDTSLTLCLYVSERKRERASRCSCRQFVCLLVCFPGGQCSCHGEKILKGVFVCSSVDTYTHVLVSCWKMTRSSSLQMDHCLHHTGNIYKNKINLNWECRDFKTQHLCVLDHLCCFLPKSAGCTGVIALVKVVKSSTWPRGNTKCSINMFLCLSACVSNTNGYLSYVKTGMIQFPELGWSKIGTTQKQKYFKKSKAESLVASLSTCGYNMVNSNWL